MLFHSSYTALLTPFKDNQIDVDAYKNLGDKINVPIIVRLEGTNSEEAKNIIDNSGLKIYSAIEFKELTTRIKEVLS